ncbi:ABC transporter permease [Vallitalea guaymasensis]|uniref:ABC transporter permease n=1 Tax=Vallitalea guaymasensis TaxID=1185412 RepID=UPI002355D3C8|nr:ABC transporter permease [Vallitalea guaymasensis]
MNIYVFKANVYKYFITLYRAYPRSFFISSILTITYTLLYSYILYEYIFEGEVNSSFIGEAGTSNYMGYILVGVLVYSFTVSTLLNVSRSLITEKRIGTLESVMLAPYNRGLYFLAYMVAQTIHTFGELVFAIPILIVFKVKFAYFDLLSFIIVLSISLLAFLGLSLLLANLMLYTRDTYISQNTLFTVMFLICGINFPITYLPSFVSKISYLIPLTHSIKLFRGILLKGESLMIQMDSVVALILQGIIYSMIGFLTLKKVEKIALEKIGG